MAQRVADLAPAGFIVERTAVETERVVIWGKRGAATLWIGAWRSGCGVCGFPCPGRQFGQAALQMAVHQAGGNVGEVGMRLDGLEFAALDQGGDNRPSFPAFVAAGEE